ncbi:hypothetical protein BOX15_Mlig009610g1 [Macrostomum lignano]|uniref:Uncharacterized protein n=1 Tax=Macrostomum lignano TaxID=282301 RepID=A0A267GB10_9PLAT|nr:hypothetical protein BOX15_Mlig009610g1 [Macrostomum lignano]
MALHTLLDMPELKRSSTTVAAAAGCSTDGRGEELIRRSITKMDWLSTARLTLQLNEEERRRAACLGKLQYLQTRLRAFEQRNQLHQQHTEPSISAQPPTPSSCQSTQKPQHQQQPELLRSATGMRLTPSTHLLAQQERDRDIQQRRRRRVGRQLPSTMNGAPLLGRSLQQAAAAGNERSVNSAAGEASLPAQTPEIAASRQQAALPPPAPPPPPPPATTPQPPPLPESVTRSAGFYKLGFAPGERGAAAPPLDGRLDGQRASLQRQRQRHRRNGGDSGGGSSYLDGQAKRFLKVTASSSGHQHQQRQPPDSIAVRLAMRDYERTFLQPRNPVNSPEPDA